MNEGTLGLKEGFLRIHPVHSSCFQKGIPRTSVENYNYNKELQRDEFLQFRLNAIGHCQNFFLI